MKLTLIPSSVGGGVAHQFLSSTLVNDSITLDAGSIGLYQSPIEQSRIRHVFLSHCHMDHVASLPILVENAFEGNPDCLTVYGSEAVLDCCQRDLFNDRIWPDFVALSTSERPFLKLARFEADQSLEVAGVRISAVALDHVVPTVGYVLADDHSAVGFISDTGPTERIWERLNAEPNLRAVFLETTFPGRLSWLAEISKHLTPALAAAEAKKLERQVPIIVIHMKARFQDEVVAEFGALQVPGLEIGQFDKPYVF